MWLAAVLALVTVSVASGYFAVRRPEAPLPVGLVPDRSVATFADVGQGETVDAEFRLTNRYPVPVDIKQVDPSCGCQVAAVSHQHLRPGEQAVVTVRWRVGAARGPTAKPVWVAHTDADGQPRRLQLAMRAEVTPDVRCEPAVVRFAPGRAATAPVRLSPGRAAAFAVRDVYANHRSVTARHLPGSGEVEVTYTPDAGGGSPGPGVLVSVVTDAPNEPTLTVPVRVGETDF
jgi:hypothetical protein